MLVHFLLGGGAVGIPAHQVLPFREFSKLAAARRTEYCRKGRKLSLVDIDDVTGKIVWPSHLLLEARKASVDATYNYDIFPCKSEPEVTSPDCIIAQEHKRGLVA